MTGDARVFEYRRATDRMREGYFDVEISAGDSDEVGKLGESLRALARNLQERFDELAKLAKITEHVNAGLVLDDVLEHIYESFRSVIPYDRLGLAMLENGGRTVRSLWAGSEGVDIKLGRGYSAELSGSSLAEVIDSGQPRILNDLEEYLAEHPNSESTRLIIAEGIRSSLTCPLAALGKPIGFLFFSSREKDTYREIHQGHFMQLASQVSVILEKSRLYEQLLVFNQRLQKMQAALEHEASHDPLTGLWSRRAVLRLLEQEAARARREKWPLTAVMLDIDHFKRTNDEHGHLVGDEVLEELSRRLVASVRSAEFVGRLGGEEFLLILCPCDEATAEMVMERTLLGCNHRPFSTAAGNLEVTISLGAATFRDLVDVDESAILDAADRALYRAKEKGRNRWELR